MTLKLTTKLFYDIYEEFFSVVEKYEVLQILHYSKENIYMIFKIKFIDRNATPNILDNLNLEFYDIGVIAEDKSKNEYICFSKHHWPDEVFKSLFNDIETFLIEPPIILEDNYLIIKFLIEDKLLDDFLNLVEKQTDVFEIVSIKTKNPNYDHLYLTLTDRQKEIIFYAVRHGYYDIPRKISSMELANKFNISKSVLWEHLRKIEKFVFNSIFS